MPDQPRDTSSDGSHTDAAREAERLDRIAREDALTGGAPGGITAEDAENVGKDQILRDEGLLGELELEPSTFLDVPSTGPDPEESILEDLGPDADHAAMQVGMSSGEGQSVDDLLRDLPTHKGGGMTQIDPPLFGLDPFSDMRRLSGCLLYLAASGLTFIGIAIFIWAFTGGRAQTEFGFVPSAPLATVTLTPRPATAAPTARPVTPLTGGPIVATQTGTTTVYTVENARGDGLRYRWTHTATCGQHAGEDTASYSWDHPHRGQSGDCPAESLHSGLIAVSVTDANGQTLTRDYPRGSAQGRGSAPADGGVTGAPSGTRTATANLSFTRISGPATLARTFSDRFTIRWNGVVDLTQLSNNHTASGTRTGNTFTARGTDGQEYRGTITESDGSAVFQGQLTGPNGSYVYSFNGETIGPITTSAPVAAATTAPSPAAAPTATATVTTGEAQSDPNYPLAGAGLLLTFGGLGLGYGGRKYGLQFPMAWPGGVMQQDKQKNACEEEKRREAQARAGRDAARQRYEQLDRLRAEHERAQAELRRAQQREARSKDDRFISWGEDVETGRRIYTNPDQRAEVANAEAALRAARGAAEAAKGAYDGAGGDAAHAAAKAELRQAEAEWQAADAALRECLGQNPPPSAPPTTGGETTTGGGASVAGGTDTGGGTRARPPQPPTPPTPPAPPPTPPTTGGGVGPETQPRVCTPGEKKPDSEQTSSHEYRVIDLRSATIVSEQSAVRTEEVPLGQGSDGEGPRGERGSGAFGETFQYWSDASDIGVGRARSAVTSNAKLQVLGTYSIRYTVRTYTLTCKRWEECNAGGTGWIRRSSMSMTSGPDAQGESPKRRASVEHADRNSVTREVMRVVGELMRALKAQNTAAEQGAKQFSERCK